MRRTIIRWSLSLGMLSLVMFALLRLTPGGACAGYEGTLQARISPSPCVRALALRRSLAEQYLAQMGLYLRGDLGTTNLGHPVGRLLVSAAPATFLLWVSSLLVPFTAFRLYAALARRRRALTAVATTWLCPIGAISGVWLGLMLLFLFAYRLHWLPIEHSQGVTVPAVGSHVWLRTLLAQPLVLVGDMVRHFMLPAVLLSFLTLSGQVHPAEQAGTGARRPDPPGPVVRVMRHLPALMAATVVVEVLFGWSGLGHLFWSSITGQDYAAALGVFLVASVVCLTANAMASAGPSPFSDLDDRPAARQSDVRGSNA